MVGKIYRDVPLHQQMLLLHCTCHQCNARIKFQDLLDSFFMMKIYLSACPKRTTVYITYYPPARHWGVYSIEAWTQPASLKKTRGTKIMHIFVKIGGGRKIKGGIEKN